MAWPIGWGSDGWETFGTPIETEPVSYHLPVIRRSLYYDPTQLGGVGRAVDQRVLTFGGATAVARGRSSAVEVEFLQDQVWGVAMLDYLVWDASEPCALQLDVYENDRETIAWIVSTVSSHPNPYLVVPERYAEQDIDPAAGAASIGAVQVTVIDRARVAGDQDSGWLTYRVGRNGYGHLAGRRGRLRRFISEELGWVTIADGPIGTVRLESDYSSLSFEIRDTREIERKIQIFKGGGGVVPVAPGLPFDPDGCKTVLPDAVWGGYGYDPESDTYLIDPAEPLTGTADIGVVAGADNNPTMRSLNLSGNSTALRTISPAAYHAMTGVIEFRNDWYEYGGILRRDYTVRFPYLTLLWREQGSEDPWTELTGTLWIDGYQEDDGSSTSLLWDHLVLAGKSGDNYRADVLLIGDERGDSVLPAENQAIEVVVVYRGPPTQDLPVYVEGITAGEFARNVYSGLYSARDEDGFIVPTGIRYDEDALLQMTDLVRIRLTEVVKDARDWLEKHIYAPTGWVPALDDDGRISPVSQVPPQSVAGLTMIHDGIAEPTPDWDSGTRIVNVVRFVYQRDYRPSNSAQAETGDGLADREIVIEWEEPLSISRHGRQVLEIKGDAFRAIGLADSAPVGGDPTVEQGAVLALLRSLYLRPRYAFGAPTISLPVMRSHTYGLRAGSWVAVDLSWLPDYVTRRRGLVGLAQVVALGDLDCAWRNAMLEMVLPPDDDYDYDGS